MSTGVPTSATSSARMSSCSSSSAACSCCRQRLRSARLVAQSVLSKARRAAAIAASMSSRVASAVGPRTASVAGLMLSNVAPLADSTSLPSMSSRSSPCWSSDTSAPSDGAESVEDGYRDVRETSDVRHVHPAKAVAVDFELRHPLAHELQRDLALHPGERGAEAAVHAVAETDVLTLLALDVEAV